MRFFAALGLMAVIPAQAVLVYDNGPIITNPTGGSGGAPISELQTAAPMSFNTFGSNVNSTFSFRQVDDFTVSSVMLIDEIELLFYSTGALAPNATGVFVSIFDGDPATTTPNQLLPGAGATANLSATPGFTVTNTFTGIYRVTSTTLADTARQVQSVRIALPAQLVLTTGTYYIEFSIQTATSAWVPYLTTRWVYTTGNAQHRLTAGNYVPLQQSTAAGPIVGATVGIPFRFYGPAAALPGAITNLGGGCGAATLEVNGAPTVGGYLHASLTNITPNPGQFRNLILGLSNPGIPIGGCSCVAHASLDVLAGFTTDPVDPNLPLTPVAPPATPFGFELQVPLTGALAGFTLYAQALTIDFGASTACNFLGIPLELSDGYEFRLNIN